MNKFIKLFFIFILGINSAFGADIVNDDIMDDLLNNINPKKPFQRTEYNYISTEKIPVKLKISLPEITEFTTINR